MTTLLHVLGQSENMPIQQIYTFVIFTHLTFVCEHPPQWNPVSILVKASSAHPFSLQASVGQIFNELFSETLKEAGRESIFFSLLVTAKSFTFKLEGKVKVFKQLFSFAFRIFKQSHPSIIVYNPHLSFFYVNLDE